MVVTEAFPFHFDWAGAPALPPAFVFLAGGLLLAVLRRAPRLQRAVLLATPLGALLIFSHCPARVIDDIAIPLAKEERGISSAVEALRRDIITTHKRIFAS